MIYLASPYSDPDPDVRQFRYEAAEEFVWEQTFVKERFIYSPIVYMHNAGLRFGGATDAKTFAHANYLSFSKSASALWILTIPGWRTSIGTKLEYIWAKKLDRPFHFVDPDGTLLDWEVPKTWRR